MFKFALLTVSLFLLVGAPQAYAAAPGDAPNVAVAASAAEALDALANAYAAAGHARPHLVSGATGKFYQQIVAGAPFDVLFAADTTYTSRLAAQGLTTKRRRYARGRLALWAPEGGIDVSRGWASLRDPRLRHLAIANPAVAPYGQAAVAALHAAGLYEALAARLVKGESAAQATHFVASGAAEAGLIPLSLAVSRAMSKHGAYWAVPTSAHAPLEAEAVLLKGGSQPQGAAEFLTFVTGPAASEIWRQHGFEAVAAPAPAAVLHSGTR